VFDEGEIIVGALIIVPHAREMIAEAALPLKLKLKIEDVQSIPTQHFLKPFLVLLGMLITTQLIYHPENKDPMHNRRKRI
jgi:hypothetical protein